jgi:hypothetical protein
MPLTALAPVTLLAAFALSAHAAPPAPAATGLTLHEWGTFTSFQGSSGRQLRYNALPGDDLPPFIFGAARQSGETDSNEEFVKTYLTGLHRMETPVIYFYTPNPITLDARVNFTPGLISEWFPPASSASLIDSPNAFRFRGASSLRWQGLHLTAAPCPGTAPAATANIPPSTASATPPPPLPPSPHNPNAKPSHYFSARGVGSSTLTLTRNGRDYAEEFLFYRGITDFPFPATLRALGNGRFEFSPGPKGSQPVAALFLISVDEDRLRFARFDNTAAPRELTLQDMPATLPDLSAAVQSALVSAGLFEKEAAAMVATWRDLWFTERGTRVLYLLPQPLIDQVLPLSTSPAATSTVRVFVGRMDILTPELESSLALARRAAKSGNEAAAKRFAQLIAPYPRFAGAIAEHTDALIAPPVNPPQ